MDKSDQHGAVLLFDGVCNFCNASVGFVVARDPRGVFRFAPLQSDVARSLLQGHKIETGTMDSVVLIENGQVYTRSTAALRVARRLRGLWPLLYVFIIIPPPLRNWAYTFVASRRYRWFGRTEACQLPTPEVAKRFLE